MKKRASFSFRYIGEDGKVEKGFAWKGSVTAADITLDKTTYPVQDIHEMLIGDKYLGLSLREQDGQESRVQLSLVRGAPEKVYPLLMALSSKVEASARKSELEAQGQGHLFKSEICPKCGATVNLTGFNNTPQVYCECCDSVFSVPSLVSEEETQYHHCPECGYYSKLKVFTEFYFYFFFVVYGYRYQTRTLCPRCMGKVATKMFFSNLLFLLGLPVAITQLIRARFAGEKHYTGLNKANALKIPKRIDQACWQYEEMEQRLGACAGVRFNHGLALMKANRWTEAAGVLRTALDDCSSYSRAYDLLVSALERSGLTSELQALKKEYSHVNQEQVPVG